MMTYMKLTNQTYQSLSECSPHHADLCHYKMNKDNLYLLQLIDN